MHFYSQSTNPQCFFLTLFSAIMASSQQQETPQQQPFTFFGPDFNLSTKHISLTSDFDSEYGRIISTNNGEFTIAQGAVLGPQGRAPVPNIGVGLRSALIH